MKAAPLSTSHLSWAHHPLSIPFPLLQRERPRSGEEAGENETAGLE